MAVALALAERGRGRTAPNPNVGCVIVRNGRIVGRGWTQPGGRPHAEAMALAQAGPAVEGATVYVTLEPCAHVSARGPDCAGLLIAAKVARVVAALGDPDLRTNGEGFARLEAAGIATESGVLADAARRSMAGFLTRRAHGRPFVTLKLATSLDGAIARADGESRWITGPEARTHAHLERSRHEAILVGRGTWEIDSPKLDVRLAGLEDRSPQRVILSRAGPSTAFGGPPPRSGEELAPDQILPGTGRGTVRSTVEGSFPRILSDPFEIATLPKVDHLLVEGGAGAASAFLAADLVDRLLLYRAPILIGAGKPAFGDIGLTSLADAHDRWRLVDARQLGSDRLEVYERQR
jgi:diaminohydroxyphosphoribosylaminopyrimidine deaminase/5-amino-6-(5-phosphoribosylamino)uracil reductase